MDKGLSGAKASFLFAAMNSLNLHLFLGVPDYWAEWFGIAGVGLGVSAAFMPESRRPVAEQNLLFHPSSLF